jgi:hypothetical protein
VYNPSGASSAKALPKRDEPQLDEDSEDFLTEMNGTLQGLSEWREKQKQERAKMQIRLEEERQKDRQKCADDIDGDEGEDMMLQQLDRLRAQRERIEQRSETSIFSCGQPYSSKLYADSCRHASEISQLSDFPEQAAKDMDKLKRELMDLEVAAAAMDSMVALVGPETSEDCPEDLADCQDLGNELLNYGSELDELLKKMDQAATPAGGGAEEKKAAAETESKTTEVVAAKCKPTKPHMGKENEPAPGDDSVFLTQSAMLAATGEGPNLQ